MIVDMAVERPPRRIFPALSRYAADHAGAAAGLGLDRHAAAERAAGLAQRAEPDAAARDLADLGGGRHPVGEQRLGGVGVGQAERAGLGADAIPRDAAAVVADLEDELVAE